MASPTRIPNNKPVLIPDPEPDFSIPVGQLETPERPITSGRPVTSPTARPQRPTFTPDLEPDFTIPFSSLEQGFPQKRPKPSKRPSPSTSPGDLTQEPQPDFSRPVAPQEGRPQVTTSRPATGTRPTFVPDLEPDFSLSFNPSGAEFPSKRPVSRPQGSIPVGSIQRPTIAPDLEPDFSVPFVPSEAQRPNKRPTSRPVTSATLIPSGGTNKPVFIPDLEPDFSVPFGAPDSGFPGERPVTTTRPSTVHTPAFTLEPQPDFSAPFDPSESSFPQRPTTVASVSISTSPTGAQFTTDSEPDFAAPISPDQQRPGERPSHGTETSGAVSGDHITAVPAITQRPG